MKRTFLAATMALGILGAACANSSSVTGAHDGDGGGGGITYPTAPDQVVVRISTGGGFIAPSYSITQLPQFSLMGDGRAVTPGAIPEIYPGPAISPLFSQQLTPDAVQAILALAKTDGLFVSSRDYTDMGSVGIADAGTTTITIVAEGETHTFNFYALTDLGQNKPDHMSQAEFDARTKAQDFATQVGDLRWLPADSAADQVPFAPTGVRVFVSGYQSDPNMSEPPIEWPLGTGLAGFGDATKGAAAGSGLNTNDGLPSRCGVVTGDELTTLMPLIQHANQLSPWKSDGKQYGLLFRPLLPDESGC
ncbi:MAG: hypothetical protein QOG88_456 [Actinomycetota bacterium]|jgi:hypothetical protein|nr:hypothetical protein [Actinomycetota bacterium]